jgi:excisionase family DNA binding protein
MSGGAPPGAGGGDRKKHTHGRPNRYRGAAEIIPLLGMDEVADWLGTTVRHVQRLVTERRIPYVKVGHFIRFDSRDVTQWIEAQKVDSYHGGVPVAITIDTEVQVAPPARLTRRPTGAAEILARWQAESR